jgi:nucleoside-diphosphate-sugar epimerase
MFDRLIGARVLVTGGAGFVGSSLVRELADLGTDVVVLDNFFSGRKEHLDGVGDRVSIIEGDVLDRDQLWEVFRSVQPSHVFHLVGDTFVPSAYRHPLRFLRINTEGTLNVLEATKDFGVERLLYVSSTEVYGRAGSAPIDESQPLAPANTYAVTKLAADRLCYTFHHEHDVPVIIARIFNCYGPRETQPYVVPEIVRQLAKGPTVQLGNRKAARDLTYVEDTARGLMAVISADIPDGEAVHVGSGEVVDLETVVAKCAPLMGWDRYRIESDPRRNRPLDVDVFLANNFLLRRTTGWEPRVGLDEGLQRTIEWFKSNGSRWVWEDWCADGIVSPPLAAGLDRGSPDSRRSESP